MARQCSSIRRVSDFESAPGGCGGLQDERRVWTLAVSPQVE
jgi:hypothetical protein